MTTQNDTGDDARITVTPDQANGLRHFVGWMMTTRGHTIENEGPSVLALREPEHAEELEDAARAIAVAATTPRDAAELAHASHDEIVKLLMAAIDLLDHVQNSRERIDVPALRKAVGRKMRSSGEAHALSLAFLVADDAPEYAESLEEYADEMAGV